MLRDLFARARAWAGNSVEPTARPSAGRSRVRGPDLVLTGMADDDELATRWCAGDPNAGQELLQRYFHRLHAFFCDKIEDDDIERCLQATFLTCRQRLEQVEDRVTFRAQLYAAAREELHRVLHHSHPDSMPLDFTTISLADLDPRTEPGGLGRECRARADSAEP